MNQFDKIRRFRLGNPSFQPYNHLHLACKKLLDRLAEDQLLSHTPQSDEIKAASVEFVQNKLYS